MNAELKIQNSKGKRQNVEEIVYSTSDRESHLPASFEKLGVF